MKAPSDWVPREVRLEAERIAQQGEPEGVIARLLITDQRMKAVWRTLRRKPLDRSKEG
jgi:hypothetical protein